MNETSLFNQMYKPDVLTCLADLSNDEIFTPPTIANAMLDLLPKEIWSDPSIKILDPSCKTGVFLREAAKRFIEGEKDVYPDLQQRIDHIFHEQLYGIAITELTSLISRRSVYCSKYPNSKFSASYFANPTGNIIYHSLQHTWENGVCSFCGAPENQYRRGKEKESYAYEFIHTFHPEEIWNMKFDVIIGNPPYHLTDGGNSTSAKPIYNLFIEQAIKLNPKYLSMIIPARWYAGGKGLDDFRKEMLHDKRIRVLVDYENYKDVFPGLGGLAGGVCYFLWDRDNPGKCEVINRSSNSEDKRMVRDLDEFDVFIRNYDALSIVHKVLNWNRGKRTLENVVSPRKPFGLPTNYEPRSQGIPCFFTQRLGMQFADPNDIVDNNKYLNKWKLLAPSTPIAGQTDFTKPVVFYRNSNTRIAKPGECCTESYLVLGAFDTEEEVNSFKSYIFTKCVMFLILQTVVSQHVNRGQFKFVPDLGKYTGTYSDEQLVNMWGINEEEWNLIDSKIGVLDNA